MAHSTRIDQLRSPRVHTPCDPCAAPASPTHTRYYVGPPSHPLTPPTHLPPYPPSPPLPFAPQSFLWRLTSESGSSLPLDLLRLFRPLPRPSPSPPTRCGGGLPIDPRQLEWHQLETGQLRQLEWRLSLVPSRASLRLVDDERRRLLHPAHPADGVGGADVTTAEVARHVWQAIGSGSGWVPTALITLLEAPPTAAPPTGSPPPTTPEGSPLPSEAMALDFVAWCYAPWEEEARSLLRGWLVRLVCELRGAVRQADAEQLEAAALGGKLDEWAARDGAAPSLALQLTLAATATACSPSRWLALALAACTAAGPGQGCGRLDLVTEAVPWLSHLLHHARNGAEHDARHVAEQPAVDAAAGAAAGQRAGLLADAVLERALEVVGAAASQPTIAQPSLLAAGRAVDGTLGGEACRHTAETHTHIDDGTDQGAACLLRLLARCAEGLASPAVSQQVRAHLTSAPVLGMCVGFDSSCLASVE